MNGFVPFNVKIRQSRVANISTERLVGRQGYVIAHLADIDGDNGRAAFAMRMLELSRIENELETRPVPLVRKTLTAAQRKGSA